MTDSTSADNSQNGEDADKPAPRVGRRKMILGMAAAGVGASVVPGAEPAGAATPDAAGKVKLGEANTATATTSVSMAVNGDSGVEGIDTSSGGGYGLYGTSENGTGIYGSITGDTRGHFAVQGADESTGDGGGAGVGGASTNGTGVYGTSTNGTGVYGIHSSGAGNGVTGLDNSGNADSHGVYGSSGSGYGVYGTSSDGDGVSGISTSGRGVSGSTASDAESGVYGSNTSTSYLDDGPPGAAGVFGTTSNPSYGAVYGYDASTSGSHLGSGVYAFSENGYGLYCLSLAGTAIYADGNAEVTGSLSKGGGSFKIDHPVDPGGKYLCHSFVESPDMMNVYNGTVILDSKGRATVELPDWFEALNRDYRYQLTAIGGPAPDLHISHEVKDGTFSIAGGMADQKVSWQVTGIRQDAWANANRIPVEVDKREGDHGRYLHPELFGGEPIAALSKALGRRRHSSGPTTQGQISKS